MDCKVQKESDPIDLFYSDKGGSGRQVRAQCFMQLNVSSLLHQTWMDV